MTNWGKYRPAIDRQAVLSGRDAPSPVDELERLSPGFVEWMQWYPDGWVTDPRLAISKTGALKALGNAIVPPQAAAAWAHLLGLPLATHTHTHRATPADAEDQRQQRERPARGRRDGPENGGDVPLMPTPAARDAKGRSGWTMRHGDNLPDVVAEL